MLTMCTLGGVEYFRGFAGVGIVPAMVAELVIAIGYLYTYFVNSARA